MFINLVIICFVMANFLTVADTSSLKNRLLYFVLDKALEGLKKLFFKTGYAMLDAESILRANGVEIIQVI